MFGHFEPMIDVLGVLLARVQLIADPANLEALLHLPHRVSDLCLSNYFLYFP